MKLISYLLVFHSFLHKHLYYLAWVSYSLIFLLLSSRSQLTGMGVLHSLVCTGFYPQRARWLKPDYVKNYRFPWGLVGDKSQSKWNATVKFEYLPVDWIFKWIGLMEFYCYVLHARCFPVVVCWFSGESWFGPSWLLLTSWHNQATSKVVVKPLGVCSHCKHAQYPKTSISC